MEHQDIPICQMASIPTPGEETWNQLEDTLAPGINWRTHLLKYVYKQLAIRKTLVRINSSASQICLSCSTITETHNHIFKCKNVNWQQITNECIVQIDQINRKWKVPTQLAQHILSQLTSWTTDTPVIGELAAINLDHNKAIQTQTKVGWGQFLPQGIHSKRTSKRSEHPNGQTAKRL
jgi:hypothetical protein